ncbi:FAD-dependent oxidoreductase [Paenibacillus tarimensis]
MNEARRVLIIGCGIAGPAAAILLKRAGCDPVVYEALPGHDDYAGLFLNVGRNGMRVLEQLGVDRLLRKEGFEMRIMSFRNGNGKFLGQVGNVTGEPQGYTFKRAFLHKILREEAKRQGIPIHFGHKLKDIEMTDNQVSALFENGETADGQLLVGCDGIHSRVRNLLLPAAAKPSFTGLISFGGFTQDRSIRFEPGVMQMVFGKKAFFGYIVRESGEVYWFGNKEYPGSPTRKDLQAIAQSEWKQLLADLYGKDIEPVPDLVRQTEGEIGVYPIYDMPPQKTWFRDRAVLIGDAIHATSPNAGQGASLALEDAMALALCLRDIRQVDRAFAKFQELRQERVERIVRYSRTLGQRKHATGPVQVFFRDLMLPLFLKSANKKSHDWMYDYRMDWEDKVRV